MISVNGKSISLVYVGASFLFLTSLLVLMPVKAEKTSDSGFNFVAAGDWGCGHEAQYILNDEKHETRIIPGSR